MFVTLDPISFQQSKPFDVDLRGDKRTVNAGALTEVKIQNQSPIPLVVRVLEDTHSIAPHMADVIPLAGLNSSQISIEPASLAAAPATGSALQGGPSMLVAVKRANAVASVQPTASFAVLITVATDGSRIPGTYPAPLVPVTQIASSIINPSLVLNATSAAAQKVIAVPDSSLFTVGQSLNVVHLAPVGPSQLTLVTAVAAASITIRDNLALAVNAGDVLVVMPPISTAPNAPLAVNLNASVVLTAGSAAAQKVIAVPDTSPFLVGQFVVLEHLNPVAPFQISEVSAVSQANSTITILDNIQTALAIGDVVFVIPPVAALKSQPVLVGTKALAAGADTLTTNPVPSTTRALLIVNESAAAAPAVAGAWITGVQTGARYAVAAGNGLVNGEHIEQANGQLDQTYLLSFTGGNSCTIAVFAIDDLAPISGSQNSSRAAAVSISPDQAFSRPSGGYLAGFPTLPQNYDSQATSNPAAGTKATVTLGALATGRWLASAIIAGAINTTAAATHLANAHLIDGGSGGAGKLAPIAGGLQALAGLAFNFGGSGFAFLGSLNTAMTLEFDAAPPATIQQGVALGAYSD